MSIPQLGALAQKAERLAAEETRLGTQGFLFFAEKLRFFGGLDIRWLSCVLIFFLLKSHSFASETLSHSFSLSIHLAKL